MKGSARGAVLRFEAIACLLALASCRTPGAASSAGPAAAPAREANPEAVLPWCTTAEACVDLARRFGTGEGVPEKSSGAVTALLGKACELGDARACVGAAVLRNHFGGQAESPRVVGLLERACDLEIGIVCQAVAEAYSEGFGVTPDLGRANVLYERACELGEASGCLALSASYEEGRGVAQDLALADAFLEKACGLRSGAACAGLAINLLRGRGAATDWKRAAEFFGQACDLGDATGCADLGVGYQNGSGVAKDQARANELHKKACDLGSGPGCKNLGLSFAFGTGVAQDWARANALYEKACQLGEGIGCNNLGFSYEEGSGLPRDQSKADELYEKGCQLGSGKACANLAHRYSKGTGANEDLKRSFELRKKACELGQAVNCLELGERFKAGADVPKDRSQADSFFQRACDLQLGDGCTALLAARYEDGDVPGSLDAFTLLALRAPEALGSLNPVAVSRAMSASFAGVFKEKRFLLLDALFDARWRPPVDRYAGFAWRDLIGMLLERGREDRAAQVAALITDVDVLLAMRIDRKYDALVRRDPGHYDLSRALAAQIRSDREAWSAAPRSLDHLMALLWTLQKAGRAEEALALADQALARVDAAGTAPFDDAHSLNWLRNRRADLLRQLDRPEEAVEELARAEKLAEDGGPNVSQRLNLAVLYCSMDRPKDALATLATVGDHSPYGEMVLRTVELRAAIALRDPPAANRALALLRAHATDATDVFVDALLWAGRLDEAARALIARLESVDDRSDALVSVQDYLPTPLTAPERQWQARWNRIRGRADVRAAIARVGRAEHFDLVQAPR